MSDTVTKPSKGMLEYMMAAEVGDDVFGADPTVNALERKAADLFGKESAIFCPSGTMTNQIAIKCHTRALDEVICDKDSHIYRYETGGFAYNSRVSIALIEGEFGKVTADQVAAKIQPTYDWLPRTSLVVLENTCNKGGGSYYTCDEIQSIHELCQSKELALHLDGARVFNALAESGDTTREIGKQFESISICMSKGLGAPVGSLLLGKTEFIRQARRFRKVMGGGMRQAGYLAAACIYALDNNVSRLKDDHLRARQLSEILEEKSFVSSINPVHTNIVIFHLSEKNGAEGFLGILKEKGILATPFGPESVRFTTHLDITNDQFNYLIETIKSL